MDERLSGQMREMDERLSGKMGEMEERLNAKIQREISGLTEDVIKPFIEMTDMRFGKLEKRLLKIEQHLESMDKRLGRVETRTEGLERRSIHIEDEVATLRTLLKNAPDPHDMDVRISRLEKEVFGEAFVV